MKRIVRLGGPKCWKRAYAVFVLCVATAIALPAQTFTTLHVFDGTDGYFTRAPLVQATNGNFYGTTVDGGVNYGKASSNCSTPPNGEGCGTVFEISPNGTLTTLHSFCAQSECADGYYPTGALIQATDGDFYGTTEAGGAQGYGTVYKLTSSGTLTTLHSFDLSDGGTRKPVSFKPPTATSTGQRQPAGPTVTLVRSSKSRRAVR